LGYIGPNDTAVKTFSVDFPWQASLRSVNRHYVHSIYKCVVLLRHLKEDTFYLHSVVI